MSFERNIKRLSGFAATVLIFFLAAGTYLASKGFQVTPDGKIVLVNEAIAAQPTSDSKPVQVVINNQNQHILGNPNAPVTIFEYSSFGCSHCADFHVNTLPHIKSKFIDTGVAKLVFVDFPLDKRSLQASLLSYCVPADDYFNYLNLIFKNQMEWSMGFNPDKTFIQYASLFDISKDKALACMKDESIKDQIMSRRQDAIRDINLQGTPAFLITNGTQQEIIHGAPSFDHMGGIIETMAKK